MIEITEISNYSQLPDIFSDIGKYRVRSYYLNNTFFTQIIDKNMEVLSAYNHICDNREKVKAYHKKLGKIFTPRNKRNKKEEKIGYFFKPNSKPTFKINSKRSNILNRSNTSPNPSI